MTLQVFDSERRIFAEEFLLRVPGWTWEQYLADAPETQISEYDRGDLIVHSPTKRPHQEAVGFLTYLLRGFSSCHGLGRVYNGPSVLRVPADVGRGPDIFVVSAADVHRRPTTSAWSASRGCDPAPLHARLHARAESRSDHRVFTAPGRAGRGASAS